MLACVGGVSSYATDSEEINKAKLDAVKQEVIEKGEKVVKKVLDGFEGGCFFDTGCYWVNLPQIGASNYAGAPIGVGGFGRLSLAGHYHVGGAGYMNTAKIRSKEDKNGSETIFAFGGVLADVYWTFGRVSPYFGTMLGAGILKNNILAVKPENRGDFVPGMSNKAFVFSVEPYVGCQVHLISTIHLFFQLSYTAPMSTKYYPQFHGLGTQIGLVFGR